MGSKQFAGREVEIAAIEDGIRNRVIVVVLSGRRYGKTSLQRRVEERLDGEDVVIIHVNAWGRKDLAPFAGALTAGADRIPRGRRHQHQQAVPEFLGRLEVGPAVEFSEEGGPTFAFRPRMAPRDADTVLSDVYKSLAFGARAAALVLEESQEITVLGEQFRRLRRGLVDEYANVSLVLAGSTRHLMERLVVAPHAPLYRMAQKVSLGPIASDKMTVCLRDRAAAGAKEMSRAAARVVRSFPPPSGRR